jgi:hypothetical protein
MNTTLGRFVVLTPRNPLRVTSWALAADAYY